VGLERDRPQPRAQSVPDTVEAIVDPRCHREDVVRRLLRLGVSVDTLLCLLPGWGRLIRTTALALPPEEIVAEATGPG
jgi:hypothetical protein